MDIGAMNVRITIQKNETVTDEIANHKSIWIDYFSCWATASGQTGGETNKAGQISEDDKLNFTVRYSSETAAVTSTGYRIKMGKRLYNIDHVDDMSFKNKCLKFHAALIKR